MRHNIWPVLQVIIGVAGLSWGIYQSVQRKYEKEIHAAAIVEHVQRIYGLQQQINAHNAQIKLYDMELDSLQKVSDENRRLATYWRQDALKHRQDVDNLKTQINEVPVILGISDDEHIRFFFDWTTRHHP
jgi:predicted metal-dependent HD superfamily phosphohydrolase